ncbi:DUF7114 family protein [Natronococcus wangiae]|uniref:DUF7114 family protein n=1 Tax=Natronococcus wangiae TaxID=3068275 RepID=UPI00273F6D4C|nr:hypothetical protein [Natronococcus sp. AD5]
MEQADRCRRAAIEAVADVEPPRLHDFIESTLDGASMLPGAFALESAAAVAPDATAVSDETDEHGSAETDGIVTHAAGVQLIYEGLRLTRSLAHAEPWTDADRGDGGDLEILAADILVARGFYLLARTDAAGKAVRTVQAFGHDQTHRLDDRDKEGDVVDPASYDANLEHDVLELAVLAGAAAVDETPSPSLLETAEELAATAGTSFPPAEHYLVGADSAPTECSLEESTTDRATSATDS